MTTINPSQVIFIEEWDAKRVYVTGTYRNLLTAKISFARPRDYDLDYLFEFMKTEEYDFIKSKVVKLIQMDLDRLNEI